MDGSFACPECGTSVSVTGLAPGRQVRCGFCHRLLEVPYLPRADNRWKRQRFSRPKWLAWAWAGITIFATVLVAAGAFRFLKTQYHAVQERSIKQLVQSSHQHEEDGRLGEALIDLDAAFDLARKAGPGIVARLGGERKRRPALARRDAEAVLKKLNETDPDSFSIGEWLNLTARAGKDPDLEPLVASIRKQFEVSVRKQAEVELAAARQALDAGKPVLALQYCDRVATLIGHSGPSDQPAIRAAAESLVKQLVSNHGVNVAQPEGDFVFGSLSTYVRELVPMLVKGLEAKGYLPRRESSPWRDLWKDSLYEMKLTIREQLEGSYLSSANRLTRIEAHLLMSSGDRVAWRITPTARSTVPLPKLPALAGARLASSAERDEELEKLLYADARGQIDEKVGFALQGMPSCPAASLVK